MMNEDQKSIEFENGPVSKLLGSLKRVEAPGDFDFHVKARIAKGRPADRNAALMPAWVRYAVPLVLLMFAGGYFGFRALYSPVANVQPTTPMAEVQQSSTMPVSEMPAKQLTEPPANKVLVAQVDEKPSNTADKPGNILPEKLVTRTILVQSEADKPAGKTNGKSRDITRLEEELSDTLATQVTIKTGAKNRGQLIIDFNDLDALDGLIARLQK